MAKLWACRGQRSTWKVAGGRFQRTDQKTERPIAYGFQILSCGFLSDGWRQTRSEKERAGGPSPWVFQAKARANTSSSRSAKFADIKAASGVNDWVAHDLRRDIRNAHDQGFE